MSDLVKTSAPGLPGLAEDREADDLAAMFCSYIDPDGPRDEIRGEVARLPTQDERARIERRYQVLFAQLRAVGQSMAEKQALKLALAEFFLGYPQLRNADADAMIAAYVTDLQDTPLFAIRLALADIKHGRVYDVDPRTQRHISLSPDWPPSSTRIITQAQTRAEATYALLAVAAKAMGIRRLAAPPLSPERQEALGRNLKALAAHLNMKRVEDEAREEERRRARREKSARENEQQIEADRVASGLPPTPPGGVVVSPQLAQIVERWRNDREDFLNSSAGQQQAADDAAREEYMAERRSKG